MYIIVCSCVSILGGCRISCQHNSFRILPSAGYSSREPFDAVTVENRRHQILVNLCDLAICLGSKLLHALQALLLLACCFAEESGSCEWQLSCCATLNKKGHSSAQPPSGAAALHNLSCINKRMLCCFQGSVLLWTVYMLQEHAFFQLLHLCSPAQV